MEFTKDTFNKCLFNPMDEDFATRASRLTAISDNVPMMKFIVCMYDPHSPVRAAYPEMEIRSIAAAQVARYEVPEDWLKDEGDLTVSAVIGFLKMVNNRTWTMIVSIEQTLWEYATQLISPIKKVGAGADKDIIAAVNMKNTTADNMIALDEKLEVLLKKFYGDPELEKAVKGKPKRITPENISKAIKNK